MRFAATANARELIPPLLDRCEVGEGPGLTPTERLAGRSHPRPPAPARSGRPETRGSGATTPLGPRRPHSLRPLEPAPQPRSRPGAPLGAADAAAPLLPRGSAIPAGSARPAGSPGVAAPPAGFPRPAIPPRRGRRSRGPPAPGCPRAGAPSGPGAHRPLAGGATGRTTRSRLPTGQTRRCEQQREFPGGLPAQANRGVNVGIMGPNPFRGQAPKAARPRVQGRWMPCPGDRGWRLATMLWRP